MANTFRITVDGAEQLTRKLEALPAIFTRDAVLAVLTSAGEPMRAAAAAKAPRSDSAPHMADSITILPTEGQPLSVSLGPTRRFFYGRFQEFGTVHHSAQPFMRPAFDTHVDSVIADVGRQFWALIKGRV